MRRGRRACVACCLRKTARLGLSHCVSGEFCCSRTRCCAARRRSGILVHFRCICGHVGSTNNMIGDHRLDCPVHGSHKDLGRVGLAPYDLWLAAVQTDDLVPGWLSLQLQQRVLEPALAICLQFAFARRRQTALVAFGVLVASVGFGHAATASQTV